MAEERQPLVRVENLHVEFVTHGGIVRAVRGVDLMIGVGEKLGLVGESGCGKSVTALSMLRLLPRPKGRISQGHVWLRHGDKEIDIVSLGFDSPEMRGIRGEDITMIFQEPMTSLNPSFTVGYQIMEAIALHQTVSKREARDRAIEALQSVGMADPQGVVDRYPHELSGGMRQRAMIAMAIACNPRLLIADEPTTALDVTVQAQILDLMRACQERSGMALLLITHNLGVVGEMCDNVAVMYLGQIVEYAPVSSIFENPRHPYTQGLLNCLPRIGADIKKELSSITGGVPGPYEVTKGCAFAPRCPHAWEKCQEPPNLVTVGECQVRCWLYG